MSWYKFSQLLPWYVGCLYKSLKFRVNTSPEFPVTWQSILPPGPSSDLESLGCRISGLKTPIWSIKHIKCGSWSLLWAIVESVSSALACHHFIRSWPDHRISSFCLIRFETKLEDPNNGHKIPHFILSRHLQINLLLQELFRLNEFSP